MGKRKVAQRNTLSQWVKASPHVLIFKVDASKLQAICNSGTPKRASTEWSATDTEIDTASRVSESISSENSSSSTAENASTKALKAPHPFFLRKSQAAGNMGLNCCLSRLLIGQIPL